MDQRGLWMYVQSTFFLSLTFSVEFQKNIVARTYHTMIFPLKDLLAPGSV
jgi:hypothetical protein